MFDQTVSNTENELQFNGEIIFSILYYF